MLRRIALRSLLFTLAASCAGGDMSTPTPVVNAPLLAPPDHGIQLNVGPFDVPSGNEVQMCQTMKLTNEEAIAVNRIQMSKRPGSHHTILFASDTDVPDQTFPCWGTVNFDIWQFIVDSQSQDFDWTLPAGKAYVFKPHQQVMVQVHYQNARFTKTPDDAYVQLNLWQTTMPSDVSQIAHGMFTVNRRIDLPPHSQGVSFSRDCIFNYDVYVFGIYGHFHSRGRMFSVDHMSAADAAVDGSRVMLEHLYDSGDWSNMTFLELPNAQIPGTGLDPSSGILVGAGEALRFTCTYDNDSDNEIVFGSHADVQEHCNLFFHYSIAQRSEGTPLTVDAIAKSPFLCVNGSGGW